jgi:hypothetical protein
MAFALSLSLSSYAHFLEGILLNWMTSDMTSVKMLVIKQERVAKSIHCTTKDVFEFEIRFAKECGQVFFRINPDLYSLIPSILVGADKSCY